LRIWVAALSILLAVITNLATASLHIPDAWAPWIVGAGALVAILMIGLEIVSHAQAEPDLPAVSADDARGLRLAVQDLWRRSENERGVSSPGPIPVRWHALAGGSNLAGELDDVVAVFGRVPERRLVVLGEPGAGKSVFCSRLVLDQPADPPPDAPVPVIFPLGSWNPEVTALVDWLTDQLIQQRLVAVSESGQDLARAMVKAGRILPILDGFDELAPGQHARALRALDERRGPMVLTSRTAQYQAAQAMTSAPPAPAVIELERLSLADLLAYLPQTGTAWEPLLGFLRDNPTDAATERLLAALGTPLMVSLARGIYGGANIANPLELLDASRFPDADAIARHLLDQYVPAVYRPPAEKIATDKPVRWSPAQARGWLAGLAVRLRHDHTHDLAWWRLRDTISWPVRAVIVGLVGAATGAAAGGLALALVGSQLSTLTDTLAHLLAYGLGAPLGIIVGLAGTGPEPVRSSLMPRRRAHDLPLFQNTVLGVAAGLAGGVLGTYLGLVRANAWLLGVIGVVLVGIAGIAFAGNRRRAARTTRGRTSMLRTTVLALAAGIAGGAVSGVAGGYVLGFTGGLVLGLIGDFEAPIELDVVPGPMDLLRTDRRNAILKTLLYALTVGPAGGFVVGLAEGARVGLVVGVAGVVGVGVGVLVGTTAWGQWILLTRLWLPLRGALAWDIPGFLEDARTRGVLRSTGGVYQFRHSRLQDRLAGD
jgi:hypothetical protein